jgi:tRNA-Thr(GGU) m(6)t(6)A37 methyltransferase TsaA
MEHFSSNIRVNPLNNRINRANRVKQSSLFIDMLGSPQRSDRTLNHIISWRKSFMVNTTQKSPAYSLCPIGYIHATEAEQRFEVEILAPYRDALQQLGEFSHVIVVWWANQHDQPASRNTMITELPYAPGVKAGVFACRSEYRPNPIALTTTPILHIDQKNGILSLAWLDAYDGTPVLDLKPYIPVTDRIRDYKVAQWMQDWPAWMEDAGAYFATHPTDFGG